MALLGGRNLLIERPAGYDLPAPLLRIKEESLILVPVIDFGNVNGTSDREAEIVLLVFGHFGRRVVEKIPGIEIVVAQELEHIAMKVLGSRFGDRFDGTG